MFPNVSSAIIPSYFFGGIQQKIVHFKRSFTDFDYQDGCARRVSSAVAKALIGIGGVSMAVAGVDLYFGFNLTSDPFSTLIITTSFATINCLGGCCLRIKINHERAQAERQYIQLRQRLLEVTVDESNKIVLQTHESLDQLDAAVQTAGEQIERRGQVINQMGIVNQQIQETVTQLRELNQEVPQILETARNRIEAAEEQNREVLVVLGECDALLEEERRKKNQQE